jgi:hypothetical protein
MFGFDKQVNDLFSNADYGPRLAVTQRPTIETE